MHITVLKALEQRATRYQVRGRLAKAETRTHSWGLDKTGTIDMTGLLQSREEMQQQEEIDIWGVSDEVRLGGNKMLDKAKDLINELGTDVVAYNKHHQNLKH